VSAVRALSAEVRRAVMIPPTRLTASEWANRSGWIARTSGASESGSYSTSRAPYLTEILDVMSDEVHRDVVFNKPAQVGFTEALNQFVGFCMAEDPSGLIVIQPNVEMAKAWMKERIDPMLDESPRLKGIVRSEGGRRTSDDTMQRKVFRGGYLVTVGANAPAGLRSRPARRILGDERSGWTLDARQQGDPWDLAVERTATFWNAKRIQGSTPGNEGTCPITAAIRASDWREYHVPCPSCGHTEPLRWRTEDGTYRVVCDKTPAGDIIPETARYLCTACGVLIPEHEKARMLRNGRWIARFPGRSVAGFDLNGLYSPWRTWADIMELWVKAQHNHERMKVFVTHVLAEPWRDFAERLEPHVLAARAEPMDPLPANVGVLVAGVDIQKDRLESLVVGVGPGEELYVVEWHQHEGDPTTPEPWHDCWQILTATRDAPMVAVAVDTGWLTDEAWKWVTAWSGKRGPRVIGTKGVPGRGRPIVSPPGRVVLAKKRRPWLIGVDTAKDTLALRLRQPVPPGGPGAVRFADTLDAAFYEQLTSEELATRIVAGRPVRVWTLQEGKRNEALDLTIMALAALHHRGARYVADVQSRPVVVSVATPDDGEPPAPAPVRRTPATRRGSWITRF
jgi:phage terminase large subunit GpA-like protein